MVWLQSLEQKARDMVVGIPELQPFRASLLLSRRCPGRYAVGAVEVVEQVGLVFFKAHGAGAGLHGFSMLLKSITQTQGFAAQSPPVDSQTSASKGR